jgi:hypothetical protein
VASHLLLDGAATPPVSGGDLPASHLFTPSMAAPTDASSMSFATASYQEGNCPPHIHSHFYDHPYFVDSMKNRRS